MHFLKRLFVINKRFFLAFNLYKSVYWVTMARLFYTPNLGKKAVIAGRKR